MGVTNISFGNIFKGSIWGIISKVISALLGFVSIPMLVGHFGKSEYGVLVLAISLNSYLKLMDMGLNIGSIRFYSGWIPEGKWDKIAAVAKSSLIFYGFIGLINALVFWAIGQFGGQYFNFSPEYADLFKWLMNIMALTAIFNWISSVFTQLLSASSDISWVNWMTIISSVLSFAAAVLVVKLNGSPATYFLWYTISTILVIPLNIYRLKRLPIPLKELLVPKWSRTAFKEVFAYSNAIFFLGIFQFSADNLRPVLLGKYASAGSSTLTDFRILQTISSLITTFGSVFLQVLIPTVSRLIVEDNSKKIESVIYDGTKYITVFISFCVFIMIVNAKVVLTLYVGDSYSALFFPLSIWLFTTLLIMHNSPVSSMVLSTGNTKSLVKMTIVSTLISLPITAVLAPRYNVNAAVIGYLIYVLMQVGFYYIYFIPRVLKYDWVRLLTRSFMPSFLNGVVSTVLVLFLRQFIAIGNKFADLIFNSGLFFLFYLIFTIAFVVKPAELRSMRQRMFA